MFCALGETGAGKGSVLWSIIDQLAPAVRMGMVEVWALDPKGGMELAAGAPLFARFVHGRDTEFADTLEAAVALMQRRQQTLRGVTRLHEPSPGEPLVVLLIDELAALTGYVGDRETKRRIANALGLLLSGPGGRGRDRGSGAGPAEGHRSGPGLVPLPDRATAGRG